jgi:hypothetical protein
MEPSRPELSCNAWARRSRGQSGFRREGQEVDCLRSCDTDKSKYTAWDVGKQRSRSSFKQAKWSTPAEEIIRHGQMNKALVLR